MSETAVSDWKEGTTSTLEIKHGVLCKVQSPLPPLTFGLTARTALGVRRTHLADTLSAVITPTENEMFLEGVCTWPLKWKIDPYVSCSLKTQITESFRARDVTLVRTAKLWDPVISQQSAGFTWEHAGRAGTGTLRTGLALKQIRARSHTAMTDDPKTRVREGWKSESGIECVYDYVLTIDSALSCRGRCSVFGTFASIKQWNTQWENEFQYKVWKALGCILSLRLLYDPRLMPGVQYSQSLSLGLIQRF